MNKKPILSICIPTYNRSECLEKTIENIVIQKEFDEKEVEIIVCDNNSTDNTEQIVKSFCDKYQNIYYYKNKENISDRNMPLVLSKANGIYRKLCNDTMIFEKGALSYMVAAINDNINDKPVIFWNQNEKKDNIITINDVQEAITRISYWATSISCFGIWEQDFVYNENGCEQHLWQVPNLYENIICRKAVKIYTKNLYTIQSVKNKDISYGLFDVFYNKYLEFVKEPIRKGILNENVLYKIKKDLLLDFFSNFIILKKCRLGSFKYNKNEQFEVMINKVYGKEKYYYRFKIKVSYSAMMIKIRTRVKRIIKR